MSAILLTGGAGYIGSHIALKLLQKNKKIVIFDDLSNSSFKTIESLRKINRKKSYFFQGDIRSIADLKVIFSNHNISTIIHLAALKNIPESITKPHKYYDVNYIGSKNLIDLAFKNNVKKFIFSSTAAVYGVSDNMPLVESDRLCPNNPYSESKKLSEDYLKLSSGKDPRMIISILRYFNPIGYDSSGCLHFNYDGGDGNIMHNILNAYFNAQKKFTIYGTDYPTKDGSGIRDYIHVTDLAEAHISCLDLAKQVENPCILNIGTGSGYSVYDLINAFNKASRKKLEVVEGKRRPGDIPENYANCDYAKKVLNWEAKKTLLDMCKDSLNWYENSS